MIVRRSLEDQSLSLLGGSFETASEQDKEERTHRTTWIGRESYLSLVLAALVKSGIR